MLREGADRLLAAGQRNGVDRGHDAAVAHAVDAEADVAEPDGRPRVLGEGVGPARRRRPRWGGSAACRARGVASSVHRSSWASDDSLASRSGATSASDTRSPGRPPCDGFTGRARGSGCHTSLAGRPSLAVSHASASAPAGSAVPWREWRHRDRLPRPRRGDPQRFVRPGRDRRARAALVDRGVDDAVSPSSSFASRAVIGSPSGSTTAQRRSPASPHGSTAAESTSTPANDLTG